MSGSKIPKKLIREIDAIESIVKNPEDKKRREKIAVFDLDNTLLIGDIGDAVFARLLLDKTPMPFSWQEYRALIEAKKKREAYEKVVTAMAGLPVATLIEATRRVMACGLPFLEPAGAQVPVPRPHPVMQELLMLLASHGYKIFVISASNQYSVHVIAKEFFNLPESRAFGIKPAVREKQEPGKGKIVVLGDSLAQPVPIGYGKVELYTEMIGFTPPLIAAGDSKTDIPMLNLVESPGLIIWVGTEKKIYESIKSEIKRSENLYFFQR